MAYRGDRPPGATTGAENDHGNRGSVDRSRWRGTTAATAVRWRGFDPQTRSTGGPWNRFAGRRCPAPAYRIHCRAGWPTEGDPGSGHAARACPWAWPAAGGAGLPAARRHEAAPAKRVWKAEKAEKAEKVNRGPGPMPFPPAVSLRGGYRLAAQQTAAHRARHRPVAARETAHSPERRALPYRPRRWQPCVAARVAPHPASPSLFRPAGASPPRCGAAS